MGEEEHCPKAWLFVFQRTSNLLQIQKDHAKAMIRMMAAEDGMLVDDSVAVVSYGAAATWALPLGTVESYNISEIYATIDRIQIARGKAQTFKVLFEELLKVPEGSPGGDTAYTIVVYSNGGGNGGKQGRHAAFRQSFIENYGLASDQLTIDCAQSLRKKNDRKPFWRKTDLCQNRVSLVLKDRLLRRLDDEVSEAVNASAQQFFQATACPTPYPTLSPTMSPVTPEPTMSPSFTPTESPSIAVPTAAPSFTPTASPVPTTLAPTTLIFSLASPCPKKWILAFETSTSLLGLQKKHALGLLDRMPVNDEGVLVYSQVAVVRYSAQAQYVVSFDTPDARDKDALQAAIQSIGQTDNGRNYNKMFRLLESPQGVGATFMPTGTDEIYTIVLYSTGRKGEGISSKSMNAHTTFVSNFLANYNIARDQFFFDCVLAKNKETSSRTLFDGSGLCDNRNSIANTEEIEVIEDKASGLFDMTTCQTEAPTNTPTLSPSAAPTKELSIHPDQPTQAPTQGQHVHPGLPTQAPTTGQNIHPEQPTQAPTTGQNIHPEQPTQAPTSGQNIHPEQPTQAPTSGQNIHPEQPTQAPTEGQNVHPIQPTQAPTEGQNVHPIQPTQAPTEGQNIHPMQPTQEPTPSQQVTPDSPTGQPTVSLSIFVGPPPMSG